MKSTRLEAFSDAVIAIVLTIMVLEFKIPQGDDLASLTPLLPVFFSYILSFIYLGLYWNNHHHMLQATEKVNGKVLWANLNLLFWLSLIPFATGWMGANRFTPLPTALYGVVLLFAAVAYTILQYAIINSAAEENKLLENAIGRDHKGTLSIALYMVAIPAAFLNEWISDAIYVAVAIMWLIPNRRIEKEMEDAEKDQGND